MLTCLVGCPAIEQGDMERQCNTDKDCGEHEQCCYGKDHHNKYCTTAIAPDVETISKYLNRLYLRSYF